MRTNFITYNQSGDQSKIWTEILHQMLMDHISISWSRNFVVSRDTQVVKLFLLVKLSPALVGWDVCT